MSERAKFRLQLLNAIALSKENSTDNISDQGIVCLPKNNNVVLLSDEMNNGTTTTTDEMACLPETNMVFTVTENGTYLTNNNFDDGSSSASYNYNDNQHKQKQYHELLPINIELPQVNASVTTYSPQQPVEIIISSSTHDFCNGGNEISNEGIINADSDVRENVAVDDSDARSDSSEDEYKPNSDNSTSSSDDIKDNVASTESSMNRDVGEVTVTQISNEVVVIPNNNIESVVVLEHQSQEQNETEKLVIQNNEVQYTKSGEIRKRRKIQKKPSERKKLRHEANRNKHPVLPPCKDVCRFKCTSEFSEERRKYINSEFWNLSYIQRRAYVLNSCERLKVKRGLRDNDGGSKKFTFKYTLKTDTGEIKHVCKSFYLCTLGYKSNNDRFVYEVLSKTPEGSITPVEDKRGKRRPSNYILKEEIDEHIESFHPVISHYRREHAPNVRYLPSDVTIHFMHQDFLEKNPTITVSYDVYRVRVKAKNISFAKLGNEECEACEHFNLHSHTKENMVDNCDICVYWKTHIELATESRKLYRKMVERNENSQCFSADLEKIIMLPRLNTFKKVIFTKRLTVYNESFVPLGKKSKTNPFAVLWHEGVSGRNQEDVVSTFYTFFKRQRDLKSLTVWLDNCSSQNKNWCFFSFLIYIVNSGEISAEIINIHYFEPGHTFMSADSFHHQVELSLKKQGKTYDFTDFIQAVQAANNGKVDIKEMKHSDFFKWANHSSQKKLKQPNRTYLKNIVQVTATRGSYNLLFKTSYSEMEPFNCLDFLTVKAMKTGLKLPEHLNQPCGFPVEKRDNILKNLEQVLPQNRRTFWVNIPTPPTNK